VQVRTDTQAEVARLGDRTGPICALVLSQDELLLVTASLDNTISLWDPSTNQPVSRPLVHPNGLRCAAFARNSRLLATSGTNKNVYIWDLQSLSGDVSVSFHVTISPNAIIDTVTRLRTASQDHHWERLQLCTH
jgi:WD40 repeat protein